MVNGKKATIYLNVQIVATVLRMKDISRSFISALIAVRKWTKVKKMTLEEAEKAVKNNEICTYKHTAEMVRADIKREKDR